MRIGKVVVRGVLAAIVLCAASPCIAQSSGGVEGTVRGSETGAPLAGVEVALFATGSKDAWRATSGADGRYRIEVPAGQYRAYTLNGLGRIDEVHPGLPCPHRRCAETGATVITVASGATQPGIDFALDRGGAIAGTVRRTGGTPIAAAVTVFDASGALVARTTTADGSWIVDGLPNGAYHVRFGASGYTSALHGGTACPDTVCDPTGSPALAVTAGAITNGIDAFLAGDGVGPDETVVYLNRCEGGCVVWHGADDSVADTTSGLRDAPGRRLDALPADAFAALAPCLRGRYARYRLLVTTEDPGEVPHREQMVVDDTSMDFGIGPGYDGFVTDFCRAEIATSLSFTFASGVHEPADLCLTSAHEFAHQFGLDHTLHAPDVMSHVHVPDRDFQDFTAPCGEEGNARPCRCGGTTTNSHQLLAGAIGLRGQSDRMTADGFE